MLFNKLKLNVFLIFICIILNTTVFAVKNNNEETQDQKNFQTALFLSKKGNILNSLDYLLNMISGDKETVEEVDTSNEEVEYKTDDKAQKIKYKEGVEAFNTGDYYDAFEIFMNLFLVAPKENAITYYLAKLYDELNYLNGEIDYEDIDSVIKGYSTIIKDSLYHKKYIRAYDYFERLYILYIPKARIITRIEEVEDYLHYITQNMYKFTIEEYHYARSYFYFRNGDIENAISEWERVLEVNPEHLEVKEYLLKFEDPKTKDMFISRKISYFLKTGISLFNNLDYELALIYFDDVLDIDPDNEIAQFYTIESKKKIEEFENMMDS